MDRRWLLGAYLSLLGCVRAQTVEAPPTLLATRVAPTHVVRDFDADGFTEPGDRCPMIAGCAPHGCPDPDSDGDGFLDSKDVCDEVAGVEPDGCPIPDSDGDTILDPDDRCPHELETRNGYADAEGCPDEVPKDLAAVTGTLRGLAFDIDKDTIRPGSRGVLDRAVAVLKKYPDVRIEVSGHTDSFDVFTRSNLSGRRARSVMRYLVEHGILEARIETRGAGPDEPIDTNKTAAGRRKNRRIEFTILVY